MNEFIATLGHIGIRDEAIVGPIIEARDKLTSPTSHVLDEKVVKTLIEEILAAISKVPGIVQSRSTLEEYQWFRLG